MQQPEKLKSVYTYVDLLNAQYIRRFESIEVLEQIHQGQREATNFNQEIVERAAHKYPYLMVLGEPGTGKTTFLRKKGLEALQGKEWGLGEDFHKQKCIPVFIELKRLASDNSIKIKNLIEEELKIFEFGQNANFFTECMLQQGKLLILLDGLDEVPTDKMDEVVEEIQDFVDLHDNNRFIVSCRTGAYRYNFHRFNDVLISYFNDEKVKHFIVNWFTQKIKLEAITNDFVDDLKNKVIRRNSQAINWIEEKWEEELEKKPEYLESLGKVNDC